MGITMLSKKYNNINQIPPAKYVGYIWMSNEQKPKILNDEIFDFKAIKNNPFIIEGLLYDDSTKTSIHILHAGEYVISQFDLNNFLNQSIEVQEYLPHRLDGVKKVLFNQIWEEENDANCAGFPVLTLKATVFCGFKNY